MTAAPDLLLQEFSDFLTLHIGLCFPRKRWPDLVRGMSAMARELDFPGHESCMRHLMRAPLSRAQIEMLAGHLAVGETYFFRDPAMFEALERNVLPRLIAARRDSGKRLRIWSAGCCSGEEAYSIAILIHRLIPDLADWDIRILGTDIHPGFLKKAALGVYRDWSFRGVPESVIQRNFDLLEPGGYAIRQHIKQLVKFEHANLASDDFLPPEGGIDAMDIILCRNVLMYFDLAKVRQVIGNLHRSLTDGGWLIVSSSELGQHLFSEFSTVNFPDATLYRKGGKPLSAALQLPHYSGAQEPLPSGGWSRRRYEQPARKGKAEDATAAPSSHSHGNKQYEAALAFYMAGAYQQTVATLMAGDHRGSLELALLARAHANQGQLQQAAAWCAAAIAADKCNPGMRYLQAVVMEELGSLEEAKAALKRALYLDQNFVLAHYALGNLYRRQGDRGAASRHFGHAVELLRGYPATCVLPESGGLAAARLIEIIRAGEGNA